MIEKTVSLEIQKAYEELRKILLRNNCKIISEEPLKSITVEHGYPSSLSPQESWKRVSFYLFPDLAGTRILSSSSIIFPIPISIVTHLIVGFLILLTIGIFIPVTGIVGAAFVGLIAILIFYENYYRLHRKKDLFSEEILRQLMQEAKSL
jgi:hypothetical protein